MTRTPPTPRGRASAVQSIRAVKHRSREVVEETQFNNIVPVNTTPGDAKITVTHGVKLWMSDSDAGITVDSTCAVTLSCGQTADDLNLANNEASELADHFAQINMKRMAAHLEKFKQR